MLDSASATVSQIADGDTGTITGNEGTTRNSTETDDTINKQIIRHLAELNEAPIVADVTIDHEFDPKIKHPKNKSWALQEMQKYGLRVDRQGFGIISFAKNKIDESFKYLNTIGEVAAFEVLPMVLKRGTIIHTEGEHKNYGHGTITIAARVKINQKPAVVAAIVKETKGHNYKVHRIKTPDGTQFVYEKEKADSTAVNGDIKHSLRSPIESATDTKITQNSPGVNSNSMQSAEKNTNAERYSIDIDSFANDDETTKDLKLLKRHVKDLLLISGGSLQARDPSTIHQSGKTG